MAKALLAHDGKRIIPSLDAAVATSGTPVWGPACTGGVYTLQRLQQGATKTRKLGCMAQEKPTLSTAKTSLRHKLTAGPLHYLQGSPPPKTGS